MVLKFFVAFIMLKNKLVNSFNYTYDAIKSNTLAAWFFFSLQNMFCCFFVENDGNDKIII